MNRLYTSYVRIGGRILTSTSPIQTYVQTKGSFRYASPRARIAVIMQSPLQEEQRYMFPIDANSSTEAEWASVAIGLSLAVERGSESIVLENDNLGVIRSLIFPNTKLRQEYARYYRDRILLTAFETSWTGARCILCEENKADGLFGKRDQPR